MYFLMRTYKKTVTHTRRLEFHESPVLLQHSLGLKGKKTTVIISGYSQRLQRHVSIT